MAAAQSQVEGGLQKLVGDMHRQTVVRSLAADPQAKGWARQTTGKSCAFCVMLAGRGAVYSARTANFSSHNHCDCMAVPKWGDRRASCPTCRRRSSVRSPSATRTTPGSATSCGPTRRPLP
jgi:hypothetical protein